MTQILLPACACVFSSLLCLIYFFKKRVNLLENKMYAIMIVCILIDSIILTTLFSFPFNGLTPLEIKLIPILNKIDFIFYLSYFTSFFLYMAIITIPNFKKNFKFYVIPFLIFNIIAIFLFMSLNVDLIYSNGYYSIKGLAVDFTYIICGTYFVISILITILNFKKIDKKHIPLFVSIIILIILLITVEIITTPYKFINSFLCL